MKVTTLNNPNVIKHSRFIGNLKAHRYRSMLDYLSKIDCTNILEIGTHKGHTASELIKHSKNKSVNYYGIDVFLNNWSKELQYAEQSIEPESKDKVQSFLNNYSKNVTLYEGKSEVILPQLIEKKILFDLVWIDGGHSYDTLKNDFNQSIKMLKDDGIIFFDDYTTEKSYPPDNEIPLGIKKFVDELIEEDNYDITIMNDYVDEYRGHLYRVAALTKK